MVEYALDIHLPDEVFEDPTLQALLVASNDLMTWPNDVCSFNVRAALPICRPASSQMFLQKEQADGDYQNLVACVMVQHKLGLQAGIDYVTQMVADRMEEYKQLKASLPSFSPSIDKELGRYITGVEDFLQGTVEWYYSYRKQLLCGVMAGA
jgi:hypothetical protein